MARTGFGRKTNGLSTVTPELKPVAAAAGAHAGTVGAADLRPNLEQVRGRAYELYQARAKAGRPGDSTTDWLEAERQLRHSAR